MKKTPLSEVKDGKLGGSSTGEVMGAVGAGKAVIQAAATWTGAGEKR